MQFSAKRDLLLNSLSLAQGIIEKKNTLEILSNILIQIKENKLKKVGVKIRRIS